MSDITTNIVIAVFAFLLGGVAGAVTVYFLPKKANRRVSQSPLVDTSSNAAKREINGSISSLSPKTIPNETLSAKPEYSSDKKKQRGDTKNPQDVAHALGTKASVPSAPAIPEGLAQMRKLLEQAKTTLGAPTERDELLVWLDEWIQQLEGAQKQIKGATPVLLAKDKISTLDSFLRTLYQPQLPSTLPPQSDKAYEALLPILHAALKCRVTLANDLQGKLGVEPILPRLGDSFDPIYHDGLAAHRCKAADGQKVGTIYRLISPGLQVKGGEVLLKAEVGIYESRA